MRPVTQEEALARFSSLAGRDLIVLATMVGGIVTEWLDRQERAKRHRRFLVSLLLIAAGIGCLRTALALGVSFATH
jgi:hypothetical protein